ncbi:hypothetical protein [Paraburkholderia sediminicola]|uniref:hypothetical protein n=1 Tax=Paraburkholderia sediminicola TaxID=458836 RepID=UPI0038BC3C25
MLLPIARDGARYAVPDNAARSHCKGATDSVAPSTGGVQRVKIILEAFCPMERSPR